MPEEEVPQETVFTITGQDSKRRIRLIEITPDALFAILCVRKTHRYKFTFEGFPTDAVLVSRGYNANYDTQRDVFRLIIRHPSFSPVDPGEVIPVLPVIVHTYRLGE